MVYLLVDLPAKRGMARRLVPGAFACVRPPKPPADLICFGPKALRQVWRKRGKLIHMRRRMHEADGYRFCVTFNLDYRSLPWMLRTWEQDCAWSVAEFERERRWPDVRDVSALLRGFDLETNGLNPLAQDARILSAADQFEAVLDPGEDFLADDDALLVGHHLKFDIKWWERFHGERNWRIHDTQLAAGLLDEEIKDNSLGYLIGRETDLPYHKEGVDRAALEKESPKKLLAYNRLDSLAAVQVAERQMPCLEERGLTPIFDLLNELTPVYARMELRGLGIDRPWRDSLLERSQSVVSRQQQRFEGINLEAPLQVGGLLYRKWRLPVVSRSPKTKQPSTDGDALARLIWKMEQGELSDKRLGDLRALVEYRKHSKLLRTYLRPVDNWTKHDGRVHTTFNLVPTGFSGTATGRLSSSAPNLQNIPRGPQVRGMFVPSPGYRWLDADYRQLELCVAAWLSGDQGVLSAFREGLDIHMATVADVWGVPYASLRLILGNEAHPDYALWKARRTDAKTVNFGILYMMGPAALAFTLWRQTGNLVKAQEARDLIARWKASRPTITGWIQERIAEIVDRGEAVSLTGRRRDLFDANCRTAWGWRKIRQGVNFLIQSLASDLTQLAILETCKAIRREGIDAHLLLNVHDQLALEFRGASDAEMSSLVRRCMVQEVPQEFERRFGKSVGVRLGVDIHIGERWS